MWTKTKKIKSGNQKKEHEIKEKKNKLTKKNKTRKQ